MASTEVVVRRDWDGTYRTDTFVCDFVKIADDALQLFKVRYPGVINTADDRKKEWDHVVSIPLRRIVEWKVSKR